MMMRPKVTVVTPTYNLIKNQREAFFRQCVESVHNQTYQNIEHIIIDGASTDGSLDLIKEYEAKGWLKCYSEKDDGMVDAMNKGIQKASGEYVAILNSDDWYNNDTIEKSVRKILEKDADFSYGITVMVKRKSSEVIYIWDCKDDKIAHFYNMAMPFNHESMLCKKSVYEKLGYYDYKKYGTIADYDFVCKLILNDFKGVYIEKKLLNFRVDGSTNVLENKENPASFCEHVKILRFMAFDLWKNWISEQEIKYLEKTLNQEDYHIPQVFYDVMNSKSFQYEVVSFLLKKQFKNFPYNILINDFKRVLEPSLSKGASSLQSSLSSSYVKKTYRLYLLSKILLLKIEKKRNIVRFFLFGVVPVFKWKEK